MGFSGKAQVDSGLDIDSKKWIISMRAPNLKPIYTKAVVVEKGGEIEDDNECRSTTPTSEEARISARRMCPPAPKKRKASLKCNFSNREFFTPPDLETVFIRHVERAN